MSYQEIYKGMVKQAFAEQVKELAGMIKVAQMNKEALDSRSLHSMGRVGRFFFKRTPKSVIRAGKAIADSKIGKDMVALPGQVKQIFAKPQGYLPGMEPSKIQTAKQGIKNMWQNNDTFRRGTKLMGATGGTLTGAKIMKGRGYKEGYGQGAKDMGDAATSLISQQGAALGNASAANQDWQKKYKEQVGGGFWEGLLALLRRLFTGEGYANG